jgi:hypothetical protein
MKEEKECEVSKRREKKKTKERKKIRRGRENLFPPAVLGRKRKRSFRALCEV